MWNEKGSTLIESLLAFEIFISVLVLYTTLFSSLYTQEAKIKDNYIKIQEKEECLSLTEDFTGIIEMVLPS